MSYYAVNVTVCTSEAAFVFYFIFFVYCVLLALTSFILILANQRIYSRFRDDIMHSFRAILLSIFPLMIQLSGDWLVTENKLMYEVFWWISVLALVVFNVITQIVVFFPAVSSSYCRCPKL